MFRPVALYYRLRNEVQSSHISNSEGKSFILKDIIRGDLDYQRSLQQPLSSCPNLRLFVDTVEDGIFVYDFLPTDLLQFSQQPLPDGTKRSVLKNVLMGLAELHSKGIVHTGKFINVSIAAFLVPEANLFVDIKPNNVLVDCNGIPGEALTVTQVRISDFDD